MLIKYVNAFSPHIYYNCYNRKIYNIHTNIYNYTFIVVY